MASWISPSGHTNARLLIVPQVFSVYCRLQEEFVISICVRHKEQVRRDYKSISLIVQVTFLPLFRKYSYVPNGTSSPFK